MKILKQNVWTWIFDFLCARTHIYTIVRKSFGIAVYEWNPQLNVLLCLTVSIYLYLYVCMCAHIALAIELHGTRKNWTNREDIHVEHATKSTIYIDAAVGGASLFFSLSPSSIYARECVCVLFSSLYCGKMVVYSFGVVWEMRRERNWEEHTTTTTTTTVTTTENKKHTAEWNTAVYMSFIIMKYSDIFFAAASLLLRRWLRLCECIRSFSCVISMTMLPCNNVFLDG